MTEKNWDVLNSEEAKPEVTMQALQIYGEIFYQMMNVEWFRELIESSFDIRKLINDEEKTIDLQVIEVPPEVKFKRMGELAKAKADKAPKIVAPTATDVMKVSR